MFGIRSCPQLFSEPISVVLPLFIVLSLFSCVESIFLQGSETSHLRFPKWNSCANSSISFNFRTTQPEGLLLYADDGGHSDFLEVYHVAGRVTAVIKISDVRSMSTGVTVNDGRWHQVEIHRNGPQTTLTVDGILESSFSFGADLNFGLGPDNNSYVYFGGLPSHFGRNLNSLSLPSAFFRKRFNGHVRNVLYGNCTCMRVKVWPLDGAGYDDQSSDLCGRYSCQRQKGCICLSLDTEFVCDCADEHCIAGAENQFKLSFDASEGRLLNQSFDVNASIHGPLFFERGVHDQALLVGAGGARVVISGADCLGTGDKCLMGFTLSLWVKFLRSCSTSNMMSSKAYQWLHSPRFTMFYDGGKLVAQFEKENQRWPVSYDNLLSELWYHVAVTWHSGTGLVLYLNGERIRQTGASLERVVANVTASKDLVVGCPSIDERECGRCQILVDELSFRSKQITDGDVRESGPLFCYQKISMDSSHQTIGQNFSVQTFGGIIGLGKVGSATYFDGVDDYLDGGDQSQACLGNLVLCKDGVTISMWVQLIERVQEFFFFSTGTRGVEIFYKDEVLVATARQGLRLWQVSWSELVDRKWYFVEVTWNPTAGLALLIDQKLVAASKAASSREVSPSGSRLYFGRSNYGVNGENSVAKGARVAAVDQVEICYGGRETLEFINVIHRGRPMKYSIDMDLIINNHFVLPHSNLSATAVRNPLNVPGKINNATRLDGNDQYIDLGYHGNSCLGNLMRCRHGFAGSMWAKFRMFDDRMFFLSNGGGIQIYNSKSLNFVFSTTEKQWTVKIPTPPTDVWHFIEFSWNPELGLKVYMHNRLLGEDREFTRIGDSALANSMYGRGSVRIGYANNDLDGPSSKSGNFLVDETEFWFSDRDTLLAFGHIARENVPNVTFTFDQPSNGLTFSVHNGAALVPGKFGDAINLKGNDEYVKFDIPRDSCAANLELCSNGLTINFFIRFNQLSEDAYILSGALYDISLRSTKLVVRFFKSDVVWEVRSDALDVDRWYRVEISWDEDKGLQLYFDKIRIAQAIEPHEYFRTASDYNVYVGKSGNDDLQFVAPNATIDQVEFWFANRDHVRAFGFLEDDVNGLTLDMERIENDLLSHQTHVIYVHGAPRTVPTNRGNALQLNGLNQFLDVGKDVACKGNLENCPKGFTLRFYIKPLQLLDNTYFVSSALIDVYFRNGLLIAEVRTPDKQWSVKTGRFDLKVWTQLDVSWDRDDGLALFVDGRSVDQDFDPVTNELDYNSTKRFLIGKANTDMRTENYANAIFDDVEIWEASRDRLIKQGNIEATRRGRNSPKRSTKVVRSTESFVIRRTTTPRPPKRTINPIAQTRAFYIHIPTGKPFRNATGRYDDFNRFFPTLPPNVRKMLVFDGHSYVVYDVMEFPAEFHRSNDFEQVRLKFKTSDPNGLLWYSGNEDRNVHFSIKGGLFLLVVNYDGKFKVEKFRVTGSRLDDNEWHNVYVTRNKRHVKIAIDGNDHPRMLIDDISFIIPDAIYLAGSANTRERTNSTMRNNFRGTLDKVIFSGDSLPNDISFIDIAFVKPTPDYIEIFGNVNSIDGGTDTATAIEPAAITFMKDYSYLRLPLWDAERRGSLEFSFKTVEPHGLILYNGGLPSHRDFFAIEIFDGIPYVVIDLGSGVFKYLFTDTPKVVNNGAAHRLRVERIERTLKLTLDKDERTQSIVSGQSMLDLGTFLFLGAVDNPNRLPWHLWTRNPKFFVGCIWGMRINDGEMLDLPSFVIEQGMSGIEVRCKTKPLACAHPLCVHGVCADRWDEPKCQCENTTYTGKLCEEPAVMVAFTGTEMTRVFLRPMLTTHTNDFSVRFKTSRKTGLLFKTMNYASNDYLKAFLSRGTVVLETNLGGQLNSFQLIVSCDVEMNHEEWHTLYVRRRANQMSAWLDNCGIRTTESPGEGYTLDIDRLVIARESLVDDPENAFVGHMQNFMIGSTSVFERLGATNITDMTIENSGEKTMIEIPIPLDPATFRLYTDAFVALEIAPTHNVTLNFMVRTSEARGMVLYRAGHDRDFLRLDLVNGRLRIAADDGTGIKEAWTTSSLNDSHWHVVVVDQLHPKKIVVSIDRQESASITFPNSSQSLDLTELLYFGGIPEAMADNISKSFPPAVGFAGCLASVFVEGHLFNLLRDSVSRSKLVTPGCTDAKGLCGPDVCKHFGSCKDIVEDFICDCNLTSFVGKTCQDEAEGYQFGSSNSRGLAKLVASNRAETDHDVLVFGFMTWHSNGTLVRAESPTNAHYIEAKLEGSQVVVEFDVGHEIHRIVQDSPLLNDSLYHYILFEHTGLNATLRVDEFPQTQLTSALETSKKLLNDFSVIKIGGDLNSDDGIINHFNGIIAGIYFNGIRVIDVGVYETEKQMMTTRGDIILASHPFHLLKPSGYEDPVKLTDVPLLEGKPTSELDTGTPEPELVEELQPPGKSIPVEVGGGGIGWKIVEKNEGMVINLLPSKRGGGGINTGRLDGMASEPVAAPMVGARVSRVPSGDDSVDGPRANAIGGTMLGLLAAASSLIWALYKFKPGLVGQTRREDGTFGVQRPVASLFAGDDNEILMPMYTETAAGQRVQVARLSSATFQVASGHSDSVAQTYVSGVGGLDLGSAFISLSAVHASNAGSGIAGLVSGNGFVSRGTQSDMTSMMLKQSEGNVGTGEWNQWRSSESNARVLRRQSAVELTSAQTQTSDFPDTGDSFDDTNLPGMNGGIGYGSGYDESFSSTTISYPSGVETGSTVYRPSAVENFRTLSPPLMFDTLHSANSFEMESVAVGRTREWNQNGYKNGTSVETKEINSTQLASEVIRVDCVLLTTNGRYVVTGSIYGPPQVWDIKTGELVKVMTGNDLSSTDLHLAGGDSLLVGQVADIAPMYENAASESVRGVPRVLQIWDFSTGNPLNMPRKESCTASCLMPDGEQIALARAEKSGNGITLTIWDLPGNQPVQTLHHEVIADHRTHVNHILVSDDSRYVAAAYQDPVNGKATFVLFDLIPKQNSATNAPKTLTFNAAAEVSVTLDDHEVVIGTWKGELVIWNISSGRILRQLLLQPTGDPPPVVTSRRGSAALVAHQGEVKAVAVSTDHLYLVSASSDHTLNLWHLETESLRFALTGHADGVNCCGFSYDSELIVSGSLDRTIRLWRTQDGLPVAVFVAGVDVFKVLVSNNKRTIVALGDQRASRKLIMLQIVRSKAKNHPKNQTPSPIKSS